MFIKFYGKIIENKLIIMKENIKEDEQYEGITLKWIYINEGKVVLVKNDMKKKMLTNKKDDVIIPNRKLNSIIYLI